MLEEICLSPSEACKEESQGVGLERSVVISRDYFCFKKRGGSTELMEVVSTASFSLKLAHCMGFLLASLYALKLR